MDTTGAVPHHSAAATFIDMCSVVKNAHNLVTHRKALDCNNNQQHCNTILFHCDPDPRKKDFNMTKISGQIWSTYKGLRVRETIRN